MKKPKKEKVVCNKAYCDILAAEFRSKGYTVEVKEMDFWDKNWKIVESVKTLLYKVTGLGIRGSFCCTNTEGYYETDCYVGNRFSVDNNRAFDKLSRCPMRVQLPLNKIDTAELWKHLQFLGSKKGFVYSIKSGKNKLPLCYL